MNRTTKIFLSILGLAAIIIPAVLLIVFTSKAQKQPNVSTGSRQIDPSTVENIESKYPKPVFATPSPASSSAKPIGASQSAQ